MPKKVYLCAKFIMHSRYIYKVLRILLVVAAYGYLAYRLAVYDRYDLLAEHFAAASWAQYACLVACLALFPLNLFLEAWKWQYLLRDVAPLTLREAQAQVYYGMVGAFVTPYRIGDYPARILLLRDKSQWLSALGMALVGSFALTLVIVFCGLPSALHLLLSEHLSGLWSVFIIALLALLLLLLAPRLLRRLARVQWRREKVRLLVEQLATLTYRHFAIVLWRSALRYLCFALQLWLMLPFCGMNLTPAEALWSIPLYYLLVTLTPNIPIADPGVRGAWALFVFGMLRPDLSAAAAMATLLLWGINTLLPIVVATVGRRWRSV